MPLLNCAQHSWSGTESVSNRAANAIKKNTLEKILYSSIVFEEIEFPLVVIEGETIYDITFSSSQIKIEDESTLNNILETLKPMCYKCVEIYREAGNGLQGLESSTENPNGDINPLAQKAN
ncbi:hypothetical protein JW897_23335 [Chromobacterium alkanivorans]|uniref:hypothetical protein n=1 Tax=Chromobacterium alkanivorans TaxID=1071719 RepID=UPI00196755E5|nr:hypothetical protein [Chromobacterium alkanivorans]MBN3006683.1 hypothetical protein [Chromobacterium alkanivorans]